MNTRIPQAISPPHVTIVGGGPAGLMAAETAAADGVRVTLYEFKPSLGRKFLLAGRGGLNLTHSEPFDRFLTRYGAAASALRSPIEAWTPDDVRAWSEALGQPTFVGTSGRVFPTAFKTSPLLRAWLRRLDAAGVRVQRRHRWLGWDLNGCLRFETPDGETVVASDSTILALGGASWPQLGSDGAWVPTLVEDGTIVAPLQPANNGFAVAWSDIFRDRFEGQPLKSIALALNGQTGRGDAVVTRHGLEGGAIYAVSSALRSGLAAGGEQKLHLALRPDLSVAMLETRLAQRQPKQSFATAMRKALALSPVAIGLLREAERHLPQSIAALDPPALARLINAVPIPVAGPMPIARAISSAGGVAFAGLDPHLMLRHRPGTFVAGEMLDWDAPTGGYLLQACFATGAAAGRGAAAWARRAGDRPPSQ